MNTPALSRHGVKTAMYQSAGRFSAFCARGQSSFSGSSLQKSSTTPAATTQRESIGAITAQTSAHGQTEKISEKRPKPQKKTMAQLDEELRMAMEGRAGDGGDSGLELEDGKPVSMKRGVKDNMFRYI